MFNLLHSVVIQSAGFSQALRRPRGGGDPSERAVFFFFLFPVECRGVKKFGFTVKHPALVSAEYICSRASHLPCAIVEGFIYTGFSVRVPLRIYWGARGGRSVFAIWRDGLFLTFTSGAGCKSSSVHTWGMHTQHLSFFFFPYKLRKCCKFQKDWCSYLLLELKVIHYLTCVLIWHIKDMWTVLSLWRKYN